MKQFKTLLAGGMLAVLVAGSASAGTVFSTTTFTGTTTTLTGLNNLLPYTDPDGRTLSAVNGGTNINSSLGLFLLGASPSVTLANLAPGTNQIGLSFAPNGVNTVSNQFFVASVTFNNGDSFIGGSSFSIGANPFMAFSDTTPFTQATVIFGSAGGFSGGLTDFRTAIVAAGTPEPASLMLFGSGAALLGLVRLRRRKNS